MDDTHHSITPIQRLAGLLDGSDINGLRAELVALLERPGAIVGLRALDQAGLLTQDHPRA